TRMTTPSPTILLPDLPPKTLVGIDLLTFTSTSNFHGIRDLPPGWHFLYTGTTESLSLRCGSWFYVGDEGNITGGSGSTNHETTRALVARSQQAGQDIIVWKWDTESETLAPLSADSDADRQEAMRRKANLGAIYSRGGLFRYRSRVTAAMLAMQKLRQRQLRQGGEEDEKEGRRDWLGLTNRITGELLDRIVGVPVVDVDGRARWMVTSASTALRDSDAIPGVTVQNEERGMDEGAIERVTGEKEREFSFVPVDLKRTWREGAVGRERTEAAQDRSWALGDLISRVSRSNGTVSEQERERVGEAQLLGELQFSFLMILTLMNYSCLQQWKRLLGLILTCRSAIRDRESFMSELLRLLLLQLRRCDDVEGGLFDLDGEEGGVFLRKLLTKFRASLYEVVEGTNSAVKTEFEKLEAFVREEYDWELNRDVILRRGMVQLEDGEEVELEVEGDNEEEEHGEYAPMIVDLGEGTGKDDSDSSQNL
ncbi:AAR2 splicing factor family protein, partial [Aspergillus homomorphus CBS 101889]